MGRSDGRGGVTDRADWSGRGGLGRTRQTGRREAYWVELGGA